MIWFFIASLVTFGIGCGTIFIGSTEFNIIEDIESYSKNETREYEMTDDLLLFPYTDFDVEYVPSENKNVKINYTFSKYCEIHETSNDKNVISAWAYCDNPTQIARDFIKNVNEKITFNSCSKK